MSLPTVLQMVYLGAYLDVAYKGAATISAAGSGYGVGNVLSIAGGTPVGGPSQYTVATIDGSGGVTSLTTTTVHPYIAPMPALPNSLTGGAGTGVAASNFVSTTPVMYARCPTGGAGLATPISEISGCFWGCSSLGQGLQFHIQSPGFADGTVFVKVVHDSGPSAGDPTMNFTVTGYVGDASSTLFSGVFSGNVPALDLMDGSNRVISNNYCVMWSINTALQTMEIWINDTSVALTAGGWVSAGSVPNPSAVWKFYSANGGFVETANLWVSISDVDWGTTANRRQFINADLSAVVVASTGIVTIDGVGSVTPAVFLHAATPDVAQDYVANNGSAAAWDAYDQTSASPTTVPMQYYLLDCLAIIPPAVTAVLNLDNLIVTSLATESPCTALQFATPPTTALPVVGLRWSDTRGATWGNAVPQGFDDSQYTQLQWNRTGYARDRVFELFYSMAYKTAINGAFVDVAPLKT